MLKNKLVPSCVLALAKAYCLPILFFAALPGSATAQTGAAAQTISFPVITGFQSVGGTVKFSASASSGLAVTFATTTSGVCTVNGNTASFSGAGICAITATQAGSSNFAPATATQSFAVSTVGLSFYDIKTLAGNGTRGYSGDGGAAINAGLYAPSSVGVDGNGNLYIADQSNQRIRKVTPGGTISTVAGNGIAGYSGDGGPATNAQLNYPCSVVVDTSGNLYIADQANQRIRMVSAATVNISTIAGNGTTGYGGDSGLATNAQLYNPSDVAVDQNGNVYIADGGNNRVRMLNAATGIVSTVAGNGARGYGGDGGPANSAALDEPLGVAVDASGNLYIADTYNGRIRLVTPGGTISTIAGNGRSAYSGDGGPATSAELYFPQHVGVDSCGNIYIGDYGNNRVRLIAPGGTITTIAGSGGFNYDGNGPATSAQIYDPSGMALDSNGNVYLAELGDSRIRELVPVGLQSSTVTPSSAIIPLGLTQQFAATATYSDGAIPNVTSLATWNSGTPATATINATGLATSVSAGTTNIVASFNGVTSPAALATVTTGQILQTIAFAPPSAAALGKPLLLTAAASSGLSVSLSSVTPGICTLSGTTAPATASFLALGTCMIVASQPGDGATYAAAPAVTATITVSPAAQTISFPAITGFQSVGGTITFGATASSGLPVSFTTASASVCTVNGNTATFNGAGTCTITATQVGNSIFPSAMAAQSFPVEPIGLSFYTIKTFAGNGVQGYGGDGGSAASAEFYSPSGVAVDGSGNLYIADYFNERVRMVNAATGNITTIAGNGTCGYRGDGGPAINAELCYPSGLALDSSGNLYIADSDSNRVRKVTPSGVISTIAGDGVGGSRGDGGPATSAELYSPLGVAVDSTGNVYIADFYNERIRMVSAATGNISTIAGNGVQGYGGDGGPAVNAQLYGPASVKIDSSGNLYIADAYNSRIRMVNVSTGLISTIAGNGNYGFSGDGGPATSAQLYQPFGLAIDSAGNLYISDNLNQRIRMVTAATGIISTIAGNGTAHYGGDGGRATSAELQYPADLALDNKGYVYVADGGNNRIRQLLPPLVLQSIAITPAIAEITPGAMQQFVAAASYSDGTMSDVTASVTWNSGTAAIATINVAGLATGIATGSTSITASLNGVTSPAAALTVAVGQTPQMITFAPSGTATVGSPLLLAATASSGLTVSLGSLTPSVCTLSGAASPATATFLTVGTCTIQASQPGSLTYAAAQTVTATITVGPGAQTISFPPITGFQSVGGTITFSASASSGLPLTFSTTSVGVCTVNGNTASFSGAGTCTIAATQAGNSNFAPATVAQSFAVAALGLSFYDITTFAGNGTAGYSGDGGPAASAELYYPTAVTVDGVGNVYIADSDNFRIRKVTPGGVITTVAGNGLGGYSGDGGPATSAQLDGAAGVAVDNSRNVYIADFYNNRIRMVIAALGNISTIAGNGIYGYSGDGGPATSAALNLPRSVAVDSSGNVYIADSGNNRIRMVSAATGNISTIAGNGNCSYGGDGSAAINAQLCNPIGVAVDSGGNVYIADQQNERVRKVTPDGTITTIAGNGIGGNSGDGGTATAAELYLPSGVALDSSGNLYIDDLYNNRIRMVNTATGRISTIAGIGSFGFSGDGGAATKAQLYFPSDVAVDSSGNVYIADESNHRIRELLPVVLQSIAVTPVSATIAPGTTQQFVATATYSDSSTQTVTSTAAWNSTTTYTATINAAGVATGVSPGTSNITASLNGLTSPASLLTVTTSTPPTSSATYVSTDTSTQGTWTNVYGADGNLIANNSTAPPSYATVSLTGDETYTWDTSSTDLRDLQTASGASTRIASNYNSFGHSFTINVNLIDGNTHRVALYLLDWDTFSRAESITISDAVSGAVLNTQNFSNLHNGVWAVWNLKGNVVITVTNTATAGDGATIVSGIFFGAPTNTASATFSGTDTTTQGTWTGTYGADGYVIANDAAAPPSYATVSFTGDETYTWDTSSTDVRDLQTASGAATRIASNYNSFGHSFTINVNLTDGNTHRVALYLLDWDTFSRAESITITDAVSGAVLNTQNFSNLHNGVWAVWNLQGNVVITVTNTATAGDGATIVSGIFFN